MTGKTHSLRIIHSVLLKWRSSAETYVTKSAAGTLTGYDAEEILDEGLIPLRAYLNTVSSIPSIATHAVQEWNYPAGEVVTDFNAVKTSIESTASWLVTRAGQFWNGYARDTTTWARTVTPFGAGATSGLRTELAADIAAIDTMLGKITSGL